MRESLRYLLLVAFFCVSIGVLAQSKEISQLQNAIEQKEFGEANKILQDQISQYSNQPDSLVGLIYYKGKVASFLSGNAKALEAVDNLIRKIKLQNASASTLQQAYIEAGEYCGYAGDNNKGYAYNLKAAKYAQTVKNITPSQLALIQNNLSTFSERTGNLEKSEQHTQNAIKLLLSDPNPDFVTLYNCYNGMGRVMFYAFKLDSALHYFNLAIKTLEKTPKTPINQYFRPAILNNNISGIYSQRGNIQKSIEALEFTIAQLQKFLESDDNSSKKSTALNLKYEAIDNLGGIYKELGDLRRAKELLTYSYEQKKKLLSKNDPEVHYSEILLGQLYYAMREYDVAINWLNRGLNGLLSDQKSNLFWLGDAYNTLALIFGDKKNISRAGFYYQKADSFYTASLQGNYDDIYLDFLRNKAQFLAENNRIKEALQVSDKSYNYILKTEGKSSLAAFYQLLNLSDIEYIFGDYKKAAGFANEGIVVANKNLLKAGSLLDSIKMEIRKPKAILYKTRALYKSLPRKTEQNLKPLLEELNKALVSLEKRKTVINDPENNRVVLEENKELIDFVKQINMDLYRLTSDQRYIDEIMSLEESVLYSRIRSRLDRNDSIRFAYVPVEVQRNERKLKFAISQSLKENLSHKNALKNYFTAVENFEDFHKKVKQDYPVYYKMRYGSIISTLGNIQQLINPNTTLVKYFFIEKEAFVLVADNKMKKIYSLHLKELERHIDVVTDYGKTEKEVVQSLFALYQMLWKPIEKDVKNKRIIVIPDKILYSLNLEVLTPKKISSFRELATESLLSKYSFSYGYSLFLLNQKEKVQNNFKDHFVAFAPGFFDNLKDSYRNTVKDSFAIDQHYLLLLPQPFTVSLVESLQKNFGGNTFVNEECTREAFIRSAGNNQIIHVGTHAISDNIYPEYSRLIFAKDKDGGDNNSFYTSDIYNSNMTSALTVLTACETGKPGYQDGEGMISLAHAFHYAGSKSILTSFWKIDEKSSAILMAEFYKNLRKGMSKDEALRHAKLYYLGNVEGRLLAPAYWAGLVILGDTDPLEIRQDNSAAIYFALGLLLLGIAGAYILSSRKKAA